MKNYEGNMEKYEDIIMKKYEGNMSWKFFQVSDPPL